MPVHCKKCDNESFATLSALRKHQWSKHRDLYAKVGKSKNERRAKFKATILGRKNGSDQSAMELLADLKKQQDFIGEVIDLLEGMIK